MSELANRILAGVWPAVSAIPSETTPAEELGVSRPALREALSRLSQARLVVSRQGGPALVTLWTGLTAVKGVHTTPHEAGEVFIAVHPRMAATWHTMIVEGAIAPFFEDVQETFAGPVVLRLDLTTFNATPATITARQARVPDGGSSGP